MADISSGYVIWVDTASLRRAAGHADTVAHQVEMAHGRLCDAGYLTPIGLAGFEIDGLQGGSLALLDRVRGLAAALRYTADVYDAVDAIWATEELGYDSVEGRAGWRLLGDLHARYEGTGRDPVDDAQALLDHREEHWDDEVVDNLALGLPDVSSWLPGVSSPREGAQLLLDSIAGVGFSVLRPGQRLHPDPSPGEYSTKSEALRPGEHGPPLRVPDFVDRIPTGEGSNVRVEKHTFEDGHAEYVVYVRGTEDMAQDGDWNVIPGPEGGAAVLDGDSAIDLRHGLASESYLAVEEALRNAGAKEGDVIHGAGHSQGAMILEWMALQGQYEFRTLVSVASPVQAMLPEGTTHVSLRYEDDPVAALQQEGIPGAAGGSGSFVVTDVHHPGPGLATEIVAPHDLERYRELAREADASADPRIARFSDDLAYLQDAVDRQVSDSHISRRGERG